MIVGAVQGDVIWLVMREVIVVVGSGIALGLVSAWGVNRLISSQLYGVTANDPATLNWLAAICVKRADDLR